MSALLGKTRCFKNLKLSVLNVLKQQQHFYRVAVPALQDGLNINNQYSTLSAVRFHPLLRNDKFMGIGTTSTASQSMNYKGENLDSFSSTFCKQHQQLARI